MAMGGAALFCDREARAECESRLKPFFVNLSQYDITFQNLNDHQNEKPCETYDSRPKPNAG